MQVIEFLSTPSVRRATSPRPSSRRVSKISIHALREEGDPLFLHHQSNSFQISIHALREEGDITPNKVPISKQVFLSTPSARRATSFCLSPPIAVFDFYPRPPRGGRQKPLDDGIIGVTFLSTPSARRATFLLLGVPGNGFISIHALREEGDVGCRNPSHLERDFYPRPPRGGRRFLSCSRSIIMRHFYPRPPRGGRLFSRPLQHGFQQFLSTPSARRAT